uniref:Neutral amino acid transporter n=1 Tax=Phaffia rhodozyma TaxID=264483 RepID=A0A1I9Q6Z5_PHARH|nr:neutral amino acid transporter [Phaffia rhodozyma]
MDPTSPTYTDEKGLALKASPLGPPLDPLPSVPTEDATNAEKGKAPSTFTSSTGGRRMKLSNIVIAPAIIEDDVDVFEQREDGPDYRGVSFWGAVVLLLKQQFGLGVLSLPGILNTMGIVPGLILILFFYVWTTYGDYVIGQFHAKHRGVHTMGDVGYIMWGPLGRELMGWGFWLFQCFIAGAGMLTISISLNAITTHGTCTVVFSLVAMIVIGLGASIRTFKHISWLSWIGMAAILPAIFLVTIACAVADRPANAPATGPFDKGLKAFGNPSFVDGIICVVNIVFSYGGSPGFLPVITEMRDPRQYTKAMFLAQTICVSLYFVITIVLWWSCGQYIASPALGSAGVLIKKIGYGIAIPGLLAGPIIFTHMSAKFCFVRALRGTRHLQDSTPLHWIVWLSLVAVMSGFSFIISQVIPFFDYLIGLVGAVFATFFCIVVIGFMWLHDNGQKRKEGPTSLSYKLLYINSLLMIFLGFALLVMGLYASIDAIKLAFASGNIGSPFACADNSNSV